MRPLIYAINLTLDGCCDHTKGIPDQELHDYYIGLLQESDTFLYGRKTYELMVPFWPDLASGNDETGFMIDYAMAFVKVPEIAVFSRSLATVDYPRARLYNGDLLDQVTQLKSQPGRAILTGGVDIPSQLIALDLVDEFCFETQPILVGEGRRLPPAVLSTKRLQLIQTLTFTSGTVVMRYRRLH